MSSEPTITELLAGLGIRHERAEHSIATGRHRLYRGDAYLGEYTAHEAVELVISEVESSPSKRRQRYD